MFLADICSFSCSSCGWSFTASNGDSCPGEGSGPGTDCFCCQQEEQVGHSAQALKAMSTLSSDTSTFNRQSPCMLAARLALGWPFGRVSGTPYSWA